MVLPGIGLDGYESYHQMGDWGADILKVGQSLGMGGFGYWDGTKAVLVSDVAERSVAIAVSQGWQAAFIAIGLLGVVWLVVWMRAYRSPEEHPRLSTEEAELIRSDQEPPAKALNVPWASLLALMGLALVYASREVRLGAARSAA